MKFPTRRNQTGFYGVSFGALQWPDLHVNEPPCSSPGRQAAFEDQGQIKFSSISVSFWVFDTHKITVFQTMRRIARRESFQKT